MSLRADFDAQRLRRKDEPMKRLAIVILSLVTALTSVPPAMDAGECLERRPRCATTSCAMTVCCEDERVCDLITDCFAQAGAQ